MMSLSHRITQTICTLTMLGVVGFFALPVLGQHADKSHAPAHKTAKEKAEHAEEAHEEAEAPAKPSAHSGKHAAAAEEEHAEHAEEHAEEHGDEHAAEKADAHGEEHAEAEAAEEHGESAEAKHDEHKAEAPATQENYDKLPFMQSANAEAVAEAPSTMGLLLRTTGALLLILGLIAATAWAVRKYGTKPGPTSPELAVLASLPIGDHQQVTALRFGDSLLLIGSTARAMTVLAMRHRRPRPIQVQATPQPARSVGDMLAHQPMPQAPSSAPQHESTQPLPFAHELANAKMPSGLTPSEGEQLIAQELSAINGLAASQGQFMGGNNKSGDLTQGAA